MKRTFFAVSISEETRRLLRNISKDIPKLKNNVRLVRPENAHITLKFLGQTDENLIPQIIERISLALKEVKMFEFKCEGTGVFPGVSHPRVLWLGITQGSDKLKILSQKINNTLEILRINKDKRGFTSHITLGRIKNTRKQVDGLEKFLSYSFQPTSNIVKNLIFYESNLKPKGAVYNPLQIFQL
ncbi:MAG: RNA 2',3'-cyclic phosphodiesterase [Candidatus Marinimicrobia bacterium]|nr:RNA 2',3'-cyclic phosphodiesterase [Candidatus Neomarinimicrobiota bacterium]